MEFSKRNNFISFLVIATAIVTAFSFVIGKDKAFNFLPASLSDNFAEKEYVNSKKQLLNPPENIKAVYVTSWSAGNQSYINYLDGLLKIADINAVVIDVKDFSGFTILDKNQKRIPNLAGLLKKLHNQGVYLIARIVVFQDPVLAKARPDLAIYDKAKTKDIKNPVLWLDNNGLAWVDPASEEVLNYNVAIARSAADLGFDEINFDYVRFPSDGDLKNMGFPISDSKIEKHIVIKKFFQELRRSLAGIRISIDLFGQTTVKNDDMGIGQILEDAFDYFDYVCPMVYPSHYAEGFMGFENPAEHPYLVVKNSMEGALKKQNAYYNVEKIPAGLAIKFRPWLQDFDMGAEYNSEMVGQEIKAVTEVLAENYNGFMLWNPSNIYTWGAIQK